MSLALLLSVISFQYLLKTHKNWDRAKKLIVFLALNDLEWEKCGQLNIKHNGIGDFTGSNPKGNEYVEAIKLYYKRWSWDQFLMWW